MPAVSNISFSVWPGSAWRLPGVFAEVTADQANQAVFVQRTLIIGQMLSSGTAVANTPIIASGLAAAQTSFGVGSMLANMYQQYITTDPTAQVWFLPLADNGAGVAGVGTMVVSGPASGSGTLNLWIAGVRVQVGVTNGDTANTIAANINTAISLNPNLPVTSSVSTATVTVTSRHKGLAANDAPIVLNYRGIGDGEITPAGVSLTITQLTGGVTDPDLATGLANLSNMSFDFICVPYTDTTQLGEVETLLSDVTGRWSFMSELFGHAFTAMKATFSGLTTFGVTNNNQHLSVLGVFGSPSPAYIIAADYCAACAQSLRIDPAVPLQTLQMNWLPPTVANQFTQVERNTLLFDGISTYTVDDANLVHIERAVTTYQENAAGAPDTSYLDVETLATLTLVIRTIRADLQTKFARCKLVSDGSRIPGGNSNITTAQIVAMEVVSVYNQLADDGEVQNPGQFAEQIVWQNNGAGTVNLGLPIMLANQLRQIAMQISFVSN